MSRLRMLTHLWPSDRHLQTISSERALRAPLPVIRRIGFTSLRGGTGCTTASVAVAKLLRSRRSRGVLHVDATGYLTVPAIDDQSNQAVPGPIWPGGEENWQRHSAAAHRQHEITVTDWGAPGLAALTSIAAHSHVVCLATTTERVPVQETLDIATALAADGTPTLIVASAVRGRLTFANRRMLALSPVPIFTLPYDASDGRTPAHAFAVAALSAEIIRRSTRTQGGERAA